jgi:benzoyl-CoA reductase subunit A
MRTVLGIDLGSTTTKAVLLDPRGAVLGRGITNSRSSYDLAAALARSEALAGARFELLDRALAGDDGLRDAAPRLRAALVARFRLEQHLAQLATLRARCLELAAAGALSEKLERILAVLERRARDPARGADRASRSDFFRDEAAAGFGKLAEAEADAATPYEALLGVFDQAIVRVENDPGDVSFEACSARAVAAVAADEPRARGARLEAAVAAVAREEIAPAFTIGTGYGRARLPFPREQIRSEILCHGLGAHAMFPRTRTVLDIGGQDTKAIQIDADGIVTSFQMNDRCAAGCGRYLGYIADEMSLGLHELGPLAQRSTRQVKISSTCTVFAGAELRDRLTLGERREDILAGLHRAIMLRAMALLARSGGVDDEFTFTGGLGKNVAAVAALGQLVRENYGARTINISADSIYTGALGAALFAHRFAERAEAPP